MNFPISFVMHSSYVKFIQLMVRRERRPLSSSGLIWVGDDDSIDDRDDRSHYEPGQRQSEQFARTEIAIILIAAIG